jgi:hypothetical protein
VGGSKRRAKPVGLEDMLIISPYNSSGAAARGEFATAGGMAQRREYHTHYGKVLSNRPLDPGHLLGREIVSWHREKVFRT